MAKKVSKISVNAFEKAANIGDILNAEVCDWNGLSVEVKRFIPMDEMVSLVESVVSSAFSSDGVYVPQVVEFALYIELIERYTNITLPKNTEKQYELIYGSDIIQFVATRINAAQLDCIRNSIDEKIDAVLDANLYGMQDRTSRIVNDMTRLLDMFSGDNLDMLEGLVNAVKDGGITADSVVSAYINAYKDSIFSRTPSSEPVVVKDND